jgi:hypothetical protein
MGTQLNETLDNGAIRQTSTNAAYPESDQNRIAEVGPFCQHLVTASQAAVALTHGLGTGALSFVTAPRAGKVIGIKWGLSTAGTHTAGSLKATVNGTAAGDAVAFDGGGTAAAVDESVAGVAALPFNKGDKLGIKVTTDANWLPVTADLEAELIVQYNP